MRSIDPKWRTVRVIRKDRDDLLLGETDTLDGELVLPGFSLALRDLFSKLDQVQD
ncbi:hypothetical protein [Tautonia marina]|uniref:hypothetical protein n=1 Tax=Tautonia marina TaxID=2653855 RepID=UPI0013761DFA|nr:hypothetical protein [Tautonia marina]